MGPDGTQKAVNVSSINKPDIKSQIRKMSRVENSITPFDEDDKDTDLEDIDGCGDDEINASEEPSQTMDISAINQVILHSQRHL